MAPPALLRSALTLTAWLSFLLQWASVWALTAPERLAPIINLIRPENKMYAELEISPQFASRRIDSNQSFSHEQAVAGWKHVFVEDVATKAKEAGGICAAATAANIPYSVDILAFTGIYSDLTMFDDVLACVRPKLVSALFNPHYSPSSRVSTAPWCSGRGDELSGASIRALELRAHRRGYDMVALENCGSVIFVAVGDGGSADRPHASRYKEGSAAKGCPLLEFYPEDLLRQCVVAADSSVLADGPSQETYRSLTEASLQVEFAQLDSYDVSFPGRNQEALTFTWKHSMDSAAKQSSEGSHDFIAIANSLARSIRMFISTLPIDAKSLRAQNSVYDVVIAEVHRKYPRLFATVTGLIGDMSAAFARSCLRGGTDKFSPHGYYRVYSRYVHQYKDLLADKNSYSLLEIGIQGGHSVKMWLDVFAGNVFIYGLDIQNGFVGENYLVFRGDQSSQNNMTAVRDHILRSVHDDVFLIIDDGSHRPEHQIASFDYFFSELLLLGGTYIVEDVETSYWSVGMTKIGANFNYGYKFKHSAIEIFKHLADDVNYEFLTEADRAAQDKLLDGFLSKKTRQLVGSVTFAQNCIIIVKKSAEDVIMYNDREYRFRHYQTAGAKQAQTPDGGGRVEL